MPYIHVKSLPLRNNERIPNTIKRLSRQFEKDTGIEERHITVTWELLEPDSYSCGGIMQKVQSFETHPLLVDLLIPDLNDHNQVQRMMKSIAASLSEELDCPINRVFINCRYARSGMVFDDGEIVEW